MPEFCSSPTCLEFLTEEKEYKVVQTSTENGLVVKCHQSVFFMCRDALIAVSLEIIHCIRWSQYTAASSQGVKAQLSIEFEVFMKLLCCCAMLQRS